MAKLNPRTTGVVTFFDIKQDPTMYVILNKKFFLLFRNKLKSKENLKNIAKAVSIHYMKVRSIVNQYQTAIKLKDLSKLCNHVEIRDEEIEKNIIELRGQNGKGIKNPKIPFNFCTKQGVRIVASLFGDGGVCGASNRPFYYNKNNLLINYLLNCIKSTMGNINYTNLFVAGAQGLLFPPVFGKILEKIGYIPGKKLENNVEIPEFIFNLPKPIILEFLSQLVDDEGYVCALEKYNKRMFNLRLTFSSKYHKNLQKSPFVCSLLKLLSKLDCVPTCKRTNIYTTKAGKMREKWTTTISGRGISNLKKLNLIIPYKRESFRKMNTMEIHMSKKESLILPLKSISEILTTGKLVNSVTLSNSLNLSAYRSREILADFHKSGFIDKIKQNKPPYTYTLTNEGNKILGGEVI